MAILTLTYQFSPATTEPPTGSQIRMDADVLTGVQKIWVRYLTVDGFDAYFALLATGAGWTLWVQDKDDHTRGARFRQTGPPLDKGGHVELPVTIDADLAPLGAQQIVLGLSSPVETATAPPSAGVPALIPPGLFVGPRSRLITPPAIEPLTIAEGKLWAGFDWPTGDPREPLLQTVIAAARAHVEDDTALALLTQTREFPVAAGGGAVVVMPPKCRPVQSVAAITWVDDSGTTQPIDPTWYAVDPGRAFVTLAPGYAWPSAPLLIRVIVGWPTVADLAADEPRLIHLVGRLTAHNMTLGRDHAISGTIVVEVPMGYADEVQPYRPEVLA